MSHAGGANSPPVKGEWRKAARGFRPPSAARWPERGAGWISPRFAISREARWFDVQAGMVAGVSKLCSQSVTSG